jgi:hypothetical protein
MVDLSVSHVGVGEPRSRLRAIAAWVGILFRSFGAASRVAGALESGRDADPADLAILGIRGPLPPVR